MIDESVAESFKEKLEKYALVRQRVQQLLDDALVELESGGLSQSSKASLYAKITELGNDGPKALIDFVPVQPYASLFRDTYGFLVEYLRAALAEESHSTRKDIAIFLKKMGEQAIDLLEYIFRNDDDNEIRVEAARSLSTLSEPGIVALENAIESGNQRDLRVAIAGIAGVVHDDFHYSRPSRRNERLIGVLSSNLDNDDKRVKKTTIRTLSDLGQVPLRVLADAIDDPDRELRAISLAALLQQGIDANNATVFVRLLEDPDRQIVDRVMAGLASGPMHDSLAMAQAIVTELIVRKSSRPVEHFNAKIVSDALRELNEQNPRVKGIILHALRDLSYEHHESSIATRCIFVADLIGEKEFRALISEKSSSNPSAASKLVRIMDTGIGATGWKPAQYRSETYVNDDRLNELRAIQSNAHDLTRLIRYCEELNICYQSGCYLAVAMLVRSILDHVPPIFGDTAFVHVANNYGGQSIKKSLLHLQNSSRNIADTYLHQAIRSRESLPNDTQVNFMNDLDVLLAEIVRVLK